MPFIKRLLNTFWVDSFLNSYSLMLFSQSKLLAVLLFFVTFFIPEVGWWGALSILLINLLTYLLGFNIDEIKQGLYGFNALFLGLALGYYYTFSFSFLILFVCGVLSLLLITLFLKGFLDQYKLPFLSLPFIFTFWIVEVSATSLESITYNEHLVYTINYKLSQLQNNWYAITHYFDSVYFGKLINTYFKILAGIFFQDSLLAGWIIAAGLLYYSRIAFILSIWGFVLAYLFFNWLGADTTQLYHSLLGANFIFLSIAIGGFFYIPNRFSLLSTSLLTPVLLITALALNKFLGVFFLKAYTLPFSLICLIFLFAFNQRVFHNYLIPVYNQLFSPEKTLYKYFNHINRFKFEHLYKLSLPFSGEWFVSQGYFGGITHIGAWGKALDFVIADSQKRTYRIPSSGKAEDLLREHFYCYNKEVLAPYDGYIYDIINSVEENDIGEVNTEHNWGNTIIINHLNGLYSQISHLKKDSIGVTIGQYVYKGTYLATCGNSGRSPEPHIHFQLQTLPFVGSQPIEYPISYYIERVGEKRYLREWEIPKQDSFICNVKTNLILKASFGFYPGQRIKWLLEGTNQTTEWEIFTDAYNRTYIKCLQTQNIAYFIFDGTMFYFTDYIGTRDGLLYHFYLGAFKVLLGYYDDITIQDTPPVYLFNYKPLQIIQDLISPIILFTQTTFNSKFTFADNPYAPQKIKISSTVNYLLFKKIVYTKEFEIILSDQKIESFCYSANEKKHRYLFNFA